jgi:hypothetical protein
MKRYLPFALIFTVIVFCGCASDHFRAGRGDAGQFILQQAIICGAHPTTTNGLSAIDGQWRYEVDKDGAVILLPREQFSGVQLFLRQAFGSPAQEPVDRSDGGKMDWYQAKTIGIGILFYYEPKHMIVTIVRPQTSTPSK